MQALLDDYVRAAGLATDLVNTSPGVWHGEDQLTDLADLTAFLAEHDVDGSPTEADLADVHAVRTRLRAVVDLRDHDAITDAASTLTEAAAGGLGLVGRQWRVVARTDASIADRLALVCGVGVLGTLRALGPERFRDCASPTCSGVFVDTSRPGRRRYCMPDLCGNRANVAAYRERRRAARDQPERRSVPPRSAAARTATSTGTTPAGGTR